MVQSRLLDVAIKEFGAKGLDGASTREIAAAAGTAMSSITYHYGGKQGLYLAAAEHIASMMSDEALLAATDAAAALEDSTAAREGIHTILAAFADKLLNPVSDDWTLFIIREQTNPGEAFDRIYAGGMGRMLEMLVRLVCVATGERDLTAARVAVITLAGQVLILKAGRAMCRKLLGTDQRQPAMVKQLKARIAANVDAILDRMISEGQDQP